jgi:hypothetical protein
MGSIEVEAGRAPNRALGCTSFAPKLTDGSICEPPQIALAILGQSREILT